MVPEGGLEPPHPQGTSDFESAEPGYGSDVLNKMMEAARVMNEIDRMSQSAGSSDAGRERCESCEWREIEKQNGDGSHCYTVSYTHLTLPTIYSV